VSKTLHCAPRCEILVGSRTGSSYLAKVVLASSRLGRGRRASEGGDPDLLKWVDCEGRVRGQEEQKERKGSAVL
jgi:hypothetical protein